MSASDSRRWSARRRAGCATSASRRGCWSASRCCSSARLAPALTQTIVMPVITAGVVAAVASPVVGWLRADGCRARRGALLLLGIVALAVGLVVLIVAGIASESAGLSGHLQSAETTIQGWLKDLGIGPESASTATSRRAQLGERRPSRRSSHGVAAGVKTLSSLAFFLALTALSLFFLLKDGPTIRAWGERHLGVPARSPASIIEPRPAVAAGLLPRASRSWPRSTRSWSAAARSSSASRWSGRSRSSPSSAPTSRTWAPGRPARSPCCSRSAAPATEAAIGMIVIQLLANGLLQQLVQPIAYGAALGIHPLAVLVVTIAGGALFGAAGLILAAPMSSAVNRIAARPARRARGGAARRPSDAGRRRRPAPGELSGRHGRTAHEEVGVLGVDDQPIFLDVAREVVAATPGSAGSVARRLGEAARRWPGRAARSRARAARRPHAGHGRARDRAADRATGTRTSWSCSSRSTSTPAPTRAVAASGAAALVRKQEFGPAALRRLWRTYAGGGPEAGRGSGCRRRELRRSRSRRRARRRGRACSAARALALSFMSKPGPSSRTSKRRSPSSSSSDPDAASPRRVLGDVLQRLEAAEVDRGLDVLGVAAAPLTTTLTGSGDCVAAARTASGSPCAASAAGKTPRGERAQLLEHAVDVVREPLEHLAGAGRARAIISSASWSRMRSATSRCWPPSWRSRSIRRALVVGRGEDACPRRAAARRASCRRARRGARSRPRRARSRRPPRGTRAARSSAASWTSAATGPASDSITVTARSEPCSGQPRPAIRAAVTQPPPVARTRVHELERRVHDRLGDRAAALLGRVRGPQPLREQQERVRRVQPPAQEAGEEPERHERQAQRERVRQPRDAASSMTPARRRAIAGAQRERCGRSRTSRTGRERAPHEARRVLEPVREPPQRSGRRAGP